MLEPVADLRGRQHAGARRRELERQRQAAQALGDRPDGRQRVVAEHEARAVLARPVDEQRDAGVGLERRDGVTVLAADPQQLPAGHDQPQRGASRVEPGHDLGAVGQQLLEVVEDEQGVRSRR